MGWTQYRESMTREQARAECQSLCRWSAEDARYKVLADGITGHGDEMGYYAAVERTEIASGGVETFCLVFLVSLSPFGYKDMDESMGPRICQPPAEVLDALLPLPAPPEVTEWADCPQCSGAGVMPQPNAHIACWRCDGNGQVPARADEVDRHRHARKWRAEAAAKIGWTAKEAA